MRRHIISVNKPITSIILISSLYRPNIGGVETVVEKLSQQLILKGHRVTILTKRYPHNLPDYEKISGVDVYRILHPSNYSEHVSFISKLKYIENKIRSNIVHVMGVRRPLPMYGLLMARKWNVPLIVTYTGGDLPSENDVGFDKIWNEGKETVISAVIQADKHTAFSKSIEEQAKTHVGKNQEIQIIKAGVDIEEINKVLPKRTGRKYFFTARRLTQVKGVDILLKAFAQIAQRVNVDLVIAGDGEEKYFLIELAQKLNISHRVVFTGNLALSEVYQYMKGSIAHICPSRAEGGGCVNIEAQAAGTVAIGSDVGGIPEYISNGKTGYLFHSGNDRELSQIMLKVARNTDIDRDFMTNQGKLNSHNYGWDSIAEKFLQIYQEGHKHKNIKLWSQFSKKIWEIYNKQNHEEKY